MPSVKDFEKKRGHKRHAAKHHGPQTHAKHGSKHAEKATLTDEAPAEVSPASSNKRRPGRNNAKAEISPEVAVVNVHADGTDEATASMAEQTSHTEANSAYELGHKEKVELNFYGSEILRAKFPKVFEVAESVATDWTHDGDFEGLPVGHPLAQYFAAKGLKKAKEMEKKVLESPVTEKVALQALQAGMKAQEMIQQIREKVQKK